MKKQVIEELNKFLTLEKNWDGYNGQVFEKTLVDRIINFINCLSDKLKIVPGPCGDGSIDIELDNLENGRYVVINFCDENDNVCRIESGIYLDEEFIGELKFNEIVEWIN